MQSGKVTKISVKGTATVIGVVNNNGGQNPLNRTGIKEKINNHTHAMYDHEGRDFTSPDCLRHYLWVEEVPNQPATEEQQNAFPEFLGSIVGLTRGGMCAAKEGTATRVSPVKVSPSTTISEKSVLIKKVGKQSKPIEGKREVDGEVSSDTSFYTYDYAGERKQKVDVSVVIKELAAVNLDQRMHTLIKKDGVADRVVASVKNTMSSLGVSDLSNIKLVKASHAKALHKENHDMLILNDEQLSALVLNVIKRVKTLEINKRCSSYKVDQGSLVVEFTNEDGESLSVSLKEAEAMLKSGKVHFTKAFEIAA